MILNFRSLFKICLNIKQIFDFSKSIPNNTPIFDIVGSFNENICKVLDCQYANFYQFDLINGQLQSILPIEKKNDKKFNEKKIPLGKGIIGHACLTKELLNIKEAYTEEKFDPYYDQHPDMKCQMKSMLIVPILNSIGDLVGIIQAVNKKSTYNTNLKIFTKDDEGLILMMTKIAENI